MDEWQGDELRESTRALLQLPDAGQVSGPVLGAIDVTVHDRRGRLEADAMGRLH